MARSERTRTRPRRRHRRGPSGELELPYDPALDDRSFLEEIERSARPEDVPARRPSRRDPRREPRKAPRHEARGESRDDDTLDAAESHYERARDFGEKKAELYLDAAKKGAIVLVLLVLPWLRFVGFVLLVVWGIKLWRRYFELLVEPGLRERIIEDEVQRQVQANVSAERVSMEGEHSRDLEQLSASIAHEIRNPITAAKSLVQQMSEEPESPDNAEYARVAAQELERVERSITHLLRFARDEEVRFTEVSMADVLDSALETFRDRAARDGIEIVRSFDTPGRVEGDADKLRRIVINLVGNGLDAMRDARTPQPRLDVSMGENLAGSEVWVRIRDNGAGIPDELRAKVFSPFVTSKSGGTGLGLPITKKLVEAHGGTIELSSKAGQGTEFLLTVPKHRRPGGSK